MVKQINLSINGMSCVGCASRLTKVLQNTANIKEAKVNFATNSAQINGDNLNIGNVLNIIEQAGFSVPTKQYVMQIGGMSCSSCAARLERYLENINSIVKVNVNFASNKAHITALDNYAEENIIQDIKNAGFSVIFPQNDISQSSNKNIKPHLNLELIKVIVALILALPLMLPMFGIYIALWVQFVLATLVQFGFGNKFYKNAFNAIKAHSSNMDVLVAIGTSSAYGLSVYLWWQSSFNPHLHLYFEASSMVIALVLLGKYLEQYTKKQTGNALSDLQKLRPSEVIIIKDNVEQTIATKYLQLNDVMLVKAGSYFGADGIIIDGTSSVDESLISGESNLINKIPGDVVHAGSINSEGRLLVKVTALGSNTQLGKIINLVETAGAEQAPIEKLVDKVSFYFVPSVIIIAFITLLVWLVLGVSFETAIIYAVTVLVIACPCALGLATPAAIMVGVGVAAKNGILLHKPQTLEKSRKINAVVFDKTGTLTYGRPQLCNIETYDIDEKKALSLATSLQASSNHPLGLALIKASEQQNLPLIKIDNSKIISGGGVIGNVSTQELALGNKRMLESYGFTNIEDNSDLTCSYLVQIKPQSKLLAKFEFADKLKINSKKTIACLHSKGIKTFILSGDKKANVAKVAHQLGINDFKAEVIPQEKLDFIKLLKYQGFCVAMIGDGVNDAPALISADIGIAMGEGTDIAINSADISLLNNEILNVLFALEISRKTYAKIKQNLFWAFIYNLCGIPLAAFGILNPVIAGFMMAFSSVSVISNSLLLKRMKLS